MTRERLIDQSGFIQERQRSIEIDGHSIKSVCSNIRRTDVAWSDLRIVPEALGQEGDLVLAEVLSDTGSTTRVENQYGRDEKVIQGDKIVGVLANRHSGTSESGGIPDRGLVLFEGIELNLLSTGGVIGIATGVPAHMGREPTRLRSLGLLGRGDVHMNLEDLCGQGHEKLGPSAPIILVLGTSAEVGKTTTSASLIRAFKDVGKNVAGTKIAGTGRMRDLLSMRDAGAFPWIDFPDAGLATTYTSAERYTPAIYKLLNLINSADPDLIIAEAGGDPIEANVPTFLSNPEIMRHVKSTIVVPGDIMGAMGTLQYLQRFNISENIFITDPKGRNTFSSRQRMRAELPGIPLFNSLDPVEVGNVQRQIEVDHF
jgi:hypothetical protein